MIMAIQFFTLPYQRTASYSSKVKYTLELTHLLLQFHALALSSGAWTRALGHGFIVQKLHLSLAPFPKIDAPRPFHCTPGVSWHMDNFHSIPKHFHRFFKMLLFRNRMELNSAELISPLPASCAFRQNNTLHQLWRIDGRLAGQSSDQVKMSMPWGLPFEHSPSNSAARASQFVIHPVSLLT